MSYLCLKCKKLGSPISFQIKRVENYPDFEKLAHAWPSGVYSFEIEGNLKIMFNKDGKAPKT